MTTDPAVRNDILSHIVVATGSEGYRAAFSLGELDPRFGGEPITIAYDDTAGQLGWCGEEDRARMVVPGAWSTRCTSRIQCFICPDHPGRASATDSPH